MFWLATARFEPRAAHKRKGKIESFVQSKLGEEAYVRNAAQPYDAQPRAEAHVLAVLVRLYSGICSSSRPCRSTWSGSVHGVRAWCEDACTTLILCVRVGWRRVPAGHERARRVTI